MNRWIIKSLDAFLRRGEIWACQVQRAGAESIQIVRSALPSQITSKAHCIAPCMAPSLADDRAGQRHSAIG
jgi:hypothetical protein